MRENNTKSDVKTAYLEWEKNLLTAYRRLLTGSREQQVEALEQFKSGHPAREINVRSRFNGYARKFKKGTNGALTPRLKDDPEDRCRWMTLSDLFALCRYSGLTPDQLLLGKEIFVHQKLLRILEGTGYSNSSVFEEKIRKLDLLYESDSFFFRKVMILFERVQKARFDREDWGTAEADFKESDYEDCALGEFGLDGVLFGTFTIPERLRNRARQPERLLTLFFLDDFQSRLKVERPKDDIGQIITSYISWGMYEKKCNGCISGAHFDENSLNIHGRTFHLPGSQLDSMLLFYDLFRIGLHIFVYDYLPLDDSDIFSDYNMDRYAHDVYRDSNDIKEYAEQFQPVLAKYPIIEAFLRFTFQHTFYRYYGSHYVWFNGISNSKKYLKQQESFRDNH